MEVPLAAAANRKLRDREIPAFDGLRVLVVDDNATNLAILKRRLTSWRTICHTADGAARGLEMMSSAERSGNPYGLALLDVNMPEVDGFELVSRIAAPNCFRLPARGARWCSWLKTQSYAAVLMDCQMPELMGYQDAAEIRRYEPEGRHTPIIAMTASSMRGDRERCLVAGMDDHLGKPPRRNELAAMLVRWIPEHQHSELDAKVIDAATAGTSAQELSRVKIFNDGVVSDLDDDLLNLSTLLATEAHSQLTLLRQTIEYRTDHAFERAAHKQKGSAAMMGATRIAAIAGRLSDRSEESDLDDDRELLNELSEALDQTSTAFRKRLERTAGDLSQVATR